MIYPTGLLFIFISLHFHWLSFCPSRHPLSSSRCSISFKMHAWHVRNILQLNKMVNSEQPMQQERETERGERDRERDREDENRWWAHECDLGNGFCFQKRLGFVAVLLITACNVSHTLSSSHSSLFLPIYPLLKKLAVDDLVPPCLPPAAVQ